MASLASEKTAAQKNSIKEAMKALKEADACLKTSLFGNWKKDWLSAAPLYARASNHYRMGKEPQKAIDCLVKASKCAAECGQEFEVGKHNQQAGMIAKSMKTEEYDRMAATFFEQAFDAYKDNGDMVTAQTSGKQAADIISKYDIHKSISIYLKVIEALEALEKWAYTYQLFRDVTRLALRAEEYTTVLDLIQRAIKAFSKGNQTNTVYQWLLGETILLVYRDDIIGADEAFLEALGHGRYGLSDQGEAAEEFLKGVKNNDAERLKAFKELPGMKFLPIPGLGRLAHEVADKIIGSNAGERSEKTAKLPPSINSEKVSSDTTSKKVSNTSISGDINVNRLSTEGVDKKDENDTQETTQGDSNRMSQASATLKDSIAETKDLLNGFEDDFDDLA